MNTPRLSVVMSVWNGERFLREAVDSVLSQTFSDFEFLVFDDLSTDGSLDILRSYRDPRMQIVINDARHGLTRNLNAGLKMAGGEYIARQDADDVSLPTRFAEQIAFLDSNPDVAVVGTWAVGIDDHGRGFLRIEKPTGVERIRHTLQTSNCLVHASVMFRRGQILDVGGYDETYQFSQDYDLWLRVSERFAIENLDQSLVKYRCHGDQISTEKLGRQWGYARRARLAALERRGVRSRPSRLKDLFGGPGTLAREYSDWAWVLESAGNPSQARKLLLLGLVAGPLDRHVWRTLAWKIINKARRYGGRLIG